MKYPVSIRKNLCIPMSDGVALAADLYAPECESPVPTLVCYYPYHKDDLIGSMLYFGCNYFAERGYAQLLVDFRGLGGSEGVAWEMGDPREGRDGAEVVEWAAQQPWCNGNVGMWGISYGGITSLQTAAAGAPHLKAIVPIHASADLYHDFIYPGGCPNCLGAYATWGSLMLAMNLMPPGFQDPQGRWRRVWTDRLGTNQPFALPWQDHPDRDEYWTSKVIPVEGIRVPTFAIGAWRDVFPERMVRLYEGLSGPKKLLMGPWTHIPPDLAPFEPFDHLHEMERWWDQWLNGRNSGILDEPPVTLYVQGENTWKNEREWPIARTAVRELYLAGGRKLRDIPVPEGGSERYRAIPTVGVTAGLWDPMALGLGAPLDQGPDDLLSLTYTSDPFLEDVEITGSPEAILYVALDREEKVHLVAKLCDVGPDSSSTLITTGWLNPDHHRSHQSREAIELGNACEVHVLLWATSYLLRAGHRLRLSIACSDFPRIWPTPTNPEIAVHHGPGQPSRLLFPLVPASDAALPPPLIRRPDPTVNRAPWHRDALPRWCLEQDLVAGTTTISTGAREHIALPSGGTFYLDHTAKSSVPAERPDGAIAQGETKVRMELPASGLVEIQATSSFSRNSTLLNARVAVNGNVLFERQWQK